MNAIAKLKSQLEREFPGAVTELTKPVNEKGIWWLDIEMGEVQLAISWRDGAGFGISDIPSIGYGEGPDEFFHSADNAYSRIATFLETSEKPSPKLNILMARLREKLGITQSEIAKRMGIQQATVSGFERREDWQISTLKRFVEAIGGTLEIFAVLGGFRYKILGVKLSEHATVMAEARKSRTVARTGYAKDRHASFSRLKSRNLDQPAYALGEEISRRHSVMAF